MNEAEERRIAQQLLKRLGAMGLEAHLLPGGRCVRARMRLRREPFRLLDGPALFGELVFATVGATHIKCLEPHALFQLPLVSVAGCTDSEGIEDRVRAAWTAQRRALEEAHDALRALGVRTGAENGATLAFPIGDEDSEAAARCLDAARLALPSRGPLSGVALARASERIAARPAAETSSDVEIALTNQLERLARSARSPRLVVRTVAPPPPAGEARPPRARPVGSGHRVLLVGPLLGRDSELLAGLRQLGHRTRVEYSIPDALSAFASQSFELVLADTHVGRAEGIELVPALAELPGIERLPVVLVDDRARESVREAAQRVGAAGYLAHPVDPLRISSGIERLLRGRGKRRFARLGQRLAAEPEGSEAGVTIAIARLGLSVRTPSELASGGMQRWTIRLTELGEDVRVDAETVYRIPAAGPEDPTAGLRIRSFPDRNEPLWIDYLTALHTPKEEDPER